MEQNGSCHLTKLSSFKVSIRNFAWCVNATSLNLVVDILEAKILGSNIIHSHHWKSGDLLLLNNPSLSHFAGPGSQGSFKVTGLRLMHRTTVGGSIKPTKQTGLNYVCRNHAPFQDQEYCLFSLKVEYL